MDIMTKEQNDSLDAILDNMLLEPYNLLYTLGADDKVKLYEFNTDNILWYTDKFYNGNLPKFIADIDRSKSVFNYNDKLYFICDVDYTCYESAIIVGYMDTFNYLPDSVVKKAILDHYEFILTMHEEWYAELQEWIRNNLL